MQRRELLLGGGAAAATALAGCLGSARENDQTRTTESARTIRVQASGEVNAEPDLAVLRVGIEATGDSAESVRADLAERSAAVRDALLEFGLDEEDVTTGRFDVRRRPDERPDPRGDGGTGEDAAYEGTHALTVEVGDVDRVGAVIDAAVAAGADSVGSVRFTLSETRRAELRERALAEALESARSEAEFVAGEVGASIVEVQSVDTSGGDVGPALEHADAETAGGAPPTELHPDEVTVSATVVVAYEIE